MFPWRVLIAIYYTYIVTGVIFLGGIGAIYTARFWGVEWAQIVLGQEGRFTFLTMMALISAVPLAYYWGLWMRSSPGSFIGFHRRAEMPSPKLVRV